MTPNEILRLRQEMRLTQRELAELLGVGQMTVSCWERGVHGIRASAAKLLTILHAERVESEPITTGEAK